MPTLNDNLPCRVNTCNQIAIGRSGYCEDHQHLIKQKMNESFAKNNQKTLERFGFNPYNTKMWRATRQFVLSESNGLCAECLKKGIYTAANEVDHIVPVHQLEIATIYEFCDPSNLQVLCTQCHKEKSSRERKSIQ